ncbi:MAG: PQQ-dependent sugar dehydrogenase, partial [Ignavibacteriaceae bacterium]
MNRKSFLGMVIILLSLSTVKAQFTLQDAYPNLSFTNPVFLTHAGDGTNRVFVIEQAGIIKVFPNTQSTSDAKIFLNITDRVSSGGEMGLLGLAFHPDYQSNGYFYVNYTADNPRRTIIARFQVTSNPDSADKNSEFEILTFNQPYSNHNGGWIGFRQSDGYLYIGTGDGGSGGDPQNNAQNITVLLGKILRIDVDGGTHYAIPPTNPFFDSSATVAKEIYAWGMRNPWRNSFDPVTDWFWSADVGQGAWEEIDLIENGKNYGWRCYEGTHSYNLAGCNYPEYVDPIYEYPHGAECSITGGYVYRGINVPELEGKYIYADYCSRKI